MNNIMKATAATALLAISSAASAELSGNVALTSDYVFRGVTQNAEKPAIQGGLDYDFGNGLAIGTWASTIDSVTYAGAGTEFDFYGSYTWELDNGLSVGLGYLRYQYPGTSATANNTDEFSLSLGYDLSSVSLSGYLGYSSDYFGPDATWYWNFGVEAPINDNLSVSAALGYTDDTDVSANSYTDYSVGISWSVGGVDLAATYTDTSGIASNSNNDERIAFSIGRSF